MKSAFEQLKHPCKHYIQRRWNDSNNFWWGSEELKWLCMNEYLQGIVDGLPNGMYNNELRSDFEFLFNLTSNLQQLSRGE